MPRGYWRGRIWPHINYWMMETLWRHGYHAQAEQLADRMMSAVQSTPWLQENYPGDARLIARNGARRPAPATSGTNRAACTHI